MFYRGDRCTMQLGSLGSHGLKPSNLDIHVIALEFVSRRSFFGSSDQSCLKSEIIITIEKIQLFQSK